MFGQVPCISKLLDDYGDLGRDAVLQEILDLAHPLAGARVLHLNIAPFGTMVSDLLRSLVPLMRAVGLAAELQVIRGGPAFREVNNAMYEGLGAADKPWTPELQHTWLKYNAMNAWLFDGDYDFVVIHDPQPAGILRCKIEQLGRRPGGKWVWHSHLDLRSAQPDLWAFLRSYAETHDAVVFPAREHVRQDLPARCVRVIPPAVDPLSPVNDSLDPHVVAQVLAQHGIDQQRPLLCQISRFDQWNDPWGTAEAYRLAKRSIPALQLVLVATVDPDDDLSRSLWQQIADRSREDPDLHLLSSVRNVGSTEMNAFQRAADICLQMSVKKGFAVSLFDAMWKGRPVIGGRSGAIPLQIADGVNGYVVADPEECARRIVQIVAQPAAGLRMGEAGHRLAREKHTITRYLRDYLLLLRDLAAARAA